MKTKYFPSHRRIFLDWILLCTVYMLLPMRTMLIIQISYGKPKRDWSRHKENSLRDKKGAVTEISKDCVWLYSMRKLLISAVTSCIRKLVILQTAMMRLA